MPDAVYRNVDVPLDDVVTTTQRRVVNGAEPGATIYGVALMPNSFADPPLPVGSQVRLYFGASNDEILLTEDLTGFQFPCGHDGGIYFSNGVALAGKVVRLLVDFGGGMAVTYAA